jgi:hypothetical protein
VPQSGLETLILGLTVGSRGEVAGREICDDDDDDDDDNDNNA